MLVQDWAHKCVKIEVDFAGKYKILWWKTSMEKQAKKVKKEVDN